MACIHEELPISANLIQSQRDLHPTFVYQPLPRQTIVSEALN